MRICESDIESGRAEMSRACGGGAHHIVGLRAKKQPKLPAKLPPFAKWPHVPSPSVDHAGDLIAGSYQWVFETELNRTADVASMGSARCTRNRRAEANDSSKVHRPRCHSKARISVGPHGCAAPVTLRNGNDHRPASETSDESAGTDRADSTRGRPAATCRRSSTRTSSGKRQCSGA